MVSTGGLIYFVLGVIISSSIAEYVPDHTDPSIPLDYDAVTEIIEALEGEEHDGFAEQDLDMQQMALNDVMYDYVYENHPDAFKKRSGHYTYRKRKSPSRFLSTKAYYPEPTDEPEVLGHHPEEPETAVEEYEVPLLEEPCEMPSEEATEYTSFEDSYGYVGSLRGKPGIDYPNYKEIPLTSFTCADKEFIPGFYADPETRCQVFHVCYPHRRESFLCPVGTIFNQPIKACDYWYNGNCSLAPKHYDANEVAEPVEVDISEEDIEAVIEELFPSEPPCDEAVGEPEVKPEVSSPMVEPELTPEPVVVEVTEMPLPKPVIPKKMLEPGPVEVTSMKKFLPVKAQVKNFVVPLAVIGKKQAKTVLKLTMKPKPPVAVPIKISKVKIAAPMKAIPVAKVLKTVPTKKVAFANKIFFAKAKPVLFKKAVAGSSVLFKKAKIAKAKKALAAKVAAPVVSALTKKHLALSLVKMLKAQKLRSFYGYPFRYVYKY